MQTYNMYSLSIIVSLMLCVTYCHNSDAHAEYVTIKDSITRMIEGALNATDALANCLEKVHIATKSHVDIQNYMDEIRALMTNSHNSADLDSKLTAYLATLRAIKSNMKKIHRMSQSNEINERASRLAELMETETPKDQPAYTVIQRRVDGTVDFDQKLWEDYAAGFGDVTGNFWIGLETMHQLTTEQPMRLDIYIELFEGEPFTFSYDSFVIGNETSNYQLFVSGFSQSAERLTRDPLAIVNLYGFTTRDNDNDDTRGNCASLSNGGWWYRACGFINLNGEYQGNQSPTYKGIMLKYIDTEEFPPENSKAVKTTEMRLLSVP